MQRRKRSSIAERTKTLKLAKKIGYAAASKQTGIKLGTLYMWGHKNKSFKAPVKRGRPVLLKDTNANGKLKTLLLKLISQNLEIESKLKKIVSKIK